MLCAARSWFPKADQYVAPASGAFSYESSSSQNINAVMLDQPSGSPDAYQVQQAIQQQAKREEVDAGMTKSQRINMVMDAARAGRAMSSNA